MRTFLQTAAIATASSAATALLFAACSAEIGGSRQGASTPAAAQNAPQPTPAASPTSPASSTPGVAPPIVTLPSADGRQAGGSPSPAVPVYQQNGASVVNITSLAVIRTGQGQVIRPQGVGSGFVIDADGRIVTNNHVVQDASQLAVTFQDKTTAPARLVGRDPDNDLAVVQVDPNAPDAEGGTLRSRIKPVTLGDSDQVIIGETAIAIGSPLGLQQTVTAGIISARRDPGDEFQLDLLGGAIQTDAAINPGNSGGPLFNANGQVIGVNSAILSQSGGNEGIGFSIPINVVKRVAPELIQTARYRHPLLGVTTIPLAQIGQAARSQLGLAPNLQGLLVIQVTDGAQQAGIQAGNRQVTISGEQIPAGGDVIVAVDGQPVATGGELRAYIENTKHPGDSVTLTIVRGGQRQDVPVTLAERPAQPQQPTDG